ncbi:OB-fold domain-containing protein [Sphingobium sp.]|uniref:Zn-ribbon domain-containing OB-fold protein n=1 Tax=Sphingobium sp. TaxID=1912891 RepID=UPI002C08831E|nr:OB-fold domain-containing protein [Sphingobium sp.]HUD93991.1 OB-fold domain-containing protein [Sphingobium sp.]
MTHVVHAEAEYAAFLAEGRFMIQRSVSTGAPVFFPRIAQPGTGLADLIWVEASGEGSVYSSTIIRNKPPAMDYVIALIDLAEGVRMMSRLVDCDPAAVAIGMRVRAHVGELDGVPAVLFVPCGEKAA